MTYAIRILVVSDAVCDGCGTAFEVRMHKYYGPFTDAEQVEQLVLEYRCNGFICDVVPWEQQETEVIP